MVPGDGTKESAILIDDEEDTGSPIDIEEAGVDDPDSPLRVFLAASMLSTDTETKDASGDKPTAKVTLTTCHAAKGLEWPVVFLPAGEQMYVRKCLCSFGDQRKPEYILLFANQTPPKWQKKGQKFRLCFSRL